MKATRFLQAEAVKEMVEVERFIERPMVLLELTEEQAKQLKALSLRDISIPDLLAHPIWYDRLEDLGVSFPPASQETVKVLLQELSRALSDVLPAGPSYWRTLV